MAECIVCEEEYSDKRLNLGYRVCLSCGEEKANKIILDREFFLREQKIPEFESPEGAGEGMREETACYFENIFE